MAINTPGSSTNSMKSSVDKKPQFTTTNRAKIELSFDSYKAHESQNFATTQSYVDQFATSINFRPINNGIEAFIPLSESNETCPLAQDPNIKTTYNQLLSAQHQNNFIQFLNEFLQFSDGRRWDESNQLFDYPKFGSTECSKSEKQIILIHGILQMDAQNNFKLINNLFNSTSDERLRATLKQQIQALRPVAVIYSVATNQNIDKKKLSKAIKDFLKSKNPDETTLKNKLGSLSDSKNLFLINPKSEKFKNELRLLLEILKLNASDQKPMAKPSLYPFDQTRQWCEMKSAKIIDQCLHDIFEDRIPVGQLSRQAKNNVCTQDQYHLLNQYQLKTGDLELFVESINNAIQPNINELSETKSKNNNLENALKNYEVNMKAMHAERVALQKENKTLQEENKTLTLEIKVLKEDYDKLLKICNDTFKSEVPHKDNFQNATKRIATLTAETERLKNSLKQLQTKNQELIKSNPDYRNLQKEVEGLQTRLAELKTAYDKVNQENGDLKKLVKQLYTRLSAKEAKKNDIRRQDKEKIDKDYEHVTEVIEELKKFLNEYCT